MVIFLLALVLAIHPGYESAACPWDNDNLVNWHNTSTWDDGTVPGENAQVVIPSGRHVLLNAQPAKLTTVTIQADASLVWGNVDGLELSVEYLLVDGAFHMGADDCRLEKRATIKLRGLIDSEYHVEDQRKMVMVREGATIEIHGKEKTPWTNLARSIPMLSDLDCALIYDHSDQEKFPIAKERQSGLHVMVWNEDGSVFDFNVFMGSGGVTYTDLKDFLASIPYGKVIAMYAFGETGLGDRTTNTQTFGDLSDIITDLYSGSQISSVDEGDSYALLTRKGSSQVQEHSVDQEMVNRLEPEEFLRLTDWERGLDFQVAKSGSTKYQYFRVLSTNISYPVLELATDVVGWEPGDKIVVTSTDFDWEQAEVREIVECSDCSASQIRVNEAFVNRHYGNITFNVDERAEVGLLSRNILIEGEMEETCPDHTPALSKLCDRFGEDTFGGHIKMLRGHVAAHIQGVELYHVGQQTQKGSYPLHFHMCDVVSDSWVKDNSIHQSFSRCVTIHGTDNLTVSGIVCYEHLGHGFFLEDSAEQNNLLYGNLGIGTKSGTLLLSDSTTDWCREDYAPNDWAEHCNELATFWITHPNNNLTNNVAAGGVCHGFMFVFSDLPLALSLERQKVVGRVANYTVKNYPIKAFYKNVAHSNEQTGVFFDSRISTGILETDQGVPENGILQTAPGYDPRDPPGDPYGQRVWTKMERVTAYRNFQENLWVKGGNINITFASIADAPEGFSGGCTDFDTGTSFEYSVAIGRTHNLGRPMSYKETLENGVVLTHQFDGSFPGNPQKTWTGTSIYQAPMYVKHSYFDRYYHWYWNDSWTEEFGKRPVSYGAGISFKKDSTYPTYASQYTTNVSFGYCDDVDNHHWVFHGNYTLFDWKLKDGTRNAHTVDRDGSLTGTPNTAIVQNRRFFTGDQCTPRPDWGSLAMCPYRYIKMEVLGWDGNLGKDMKTKWPLILHRDDEPGDPFTAEGEIRREYLLQTHRSYLVDFNTTVDGAAFPTAVKIFGYGVETQDVVRVGICVPMNMTDFIVDSVHPVLIRKTNFTTADSLTELDAEIEGNSFYHDKENGIIFFKIWSRYDRTNDSQLCTAGICYRIKLTFNDGNFSSLRSCFGAQYPAFTDTRPVPPKPTKPPCPGIGSPQGLGAVRWEEVTKIVHDDLSITCRQPTEYNRNETREEGCFLTSSQDTMLKQTLKNSMTRSWCTRRCFFRGFKYAGLRSGMICECLVGDVNRSARATNLKGKECTKQCTGDSSETCGNSGRTLVMYTGL